MSDRLVELEGILRTLRDRGPLSSDALARVLDLHSFDLRLALVDAATWGLIGRDRRGAWSLADRGVALVTPSLPVADLGDSVIGRVKRSLRRGFRRAALRRSASP